MKNLHIIPTDKPSRLYKRIDLNTFHLGDYDVCMPDDTIRTNQHIYITSDEKTLPRKGDWYLGHPLYTSIHRWHTDVSKIDGRNVWINKIILTTDQDLIGVQAIDDEFLEWFVKNPSCESVEVHELRFFNPDTNESGHCKWELIIPKEEDKQFVECKCTNSLQAENCIRNCGHGEEPKQETLEEAAQRAIKSGLFKDKTLFIAGAKWQQEIMFKIMDTYAEDVMGGSILRAKEWFEQFKKK